MKRNIYDEDFKKMIVSLMMNGQGASQLKREYGISESTIYKWRELYTKESETDVSKADYLKLQKQIKKLAEENDILKKVLTIFAEKEK